MLFRETPVDHLKPEEGISLRFGAKVPGPFVDVGAVKMHSTMRTIWAALRAVMVEAGWCVVQPLLDVWASKPPPIFRTTPPEVGGQQKPTSCCVVTVIAK